MDPYIIDRRILKELHVDYDNYLCQYGSRKGPKLPRITTSLWTLNLYNNSLLSEGNNYSS